MTKTIRQIFVCVFVQQGWTWGTPKWWRYPREPSVSTGSTWVIRDRWSMTVTLKSQLAEPCFASFTLNLNSSWGNRSNFCCMFRTHRLFSRMVYVLCEALKSLWHLQPQSSRTARGLGQVMLAISSRLAAWKALFLAKQLAPSFTSLVIVSIELSHSKHLHLSK